MDPKVKLRLEIIEILFQFNDSVNAIELYKEMGSYCLNEMINSKNLIMNSLLLNAVISIFIITENDCRAISLKNILDDIKKEKLFNTDTINKLNNLFDIIKGEKYNALKTWRNKYLVHRDNHSISELAKCEFTIPQIEDIQNSIKDLLDELNNLFEIDINKLNLKTNDFIKFAEELNLL